MKNQEGMQFNYTLASIATALDIFTECSLDTLFVEMFLSPCVDFVPPLTVTSKQE